MTGHVRVTQIAFDPAKISYARLPEVFWQVRKDFHNPIVMETVPLKKFYRAVDYHQEYFDDS